MSDFLVLNIFGKGAASQQTLYATFTFLDKEILVTPDFIRGLSVVLAIVIFLIGALIYGLLCFLYSVKESELQKTKNAISKAEQDISTLQSQGGIVDINAIVSKIMNDNKKAISFYDSLASDIPNNVWLTYYYNKEGEKVAVEGISTTINDIYGYYKSLKIISPQSSIKLNRLQVVTGPLDDMEFAVNDNQKIFDFEIANVASPKSLKGNSTENNQQQAGSTPQQNGGTSGTNVAPPVLPKLEPVDMN